MIWPVLQQLMKAGVTGDELVAAIREIEESAAPKRSTGAERQARYRLRQSAIEASPVTSHNAVTSRDAVKAISFLREVTKEEEKKEIADERDGDVTPSRNVTRGTKIPVDWKPSQKVIDYGLSLGYAESQISEQMEGLRDWALANSNRAVARKADWELTATSWLRRNKPKDMKPPPPPVQTGPPKPPRPGLPSHEECLERARRMNGSVEGGTGLRRESDGVLQEHAGREGQANNDPARHGGMANLGTLFHRIPRV